MPANPEYADGILVQKAEAHEPGTAVTVASASSTAIVAARPGRTHLFISNTDTANAVYLRFATTGAAVGTGVRLAPGAVLALDRYTGAVSARAETADVDVAVAEI
jgi:hypothetical protein